MLKIDSNYKLYIDGKWVSSSDGKTFDAFSPVNGEKLATCEEASKSDVDKAVAAARKAFTTWRHVGAYERSAMLNKIADVMEANKEHLAMVETYDNGKPIRETMNVDVPLAIEHFRYFAGVILAEEGSSSFLQNNTLSIITREPIGVVGQIVPWNFPLLMAAWKIAPLLACGCVSVFKPSKSTSLSVLEFTKLIDGILPAGVFNLITGSGAKSGEFILQHKDIDKLAFTGSTEVGRSVAQAAADKLIPATLELGGKSANIFFDDCNFEMAMDGLQLGILFNQGQVCCAGSRVFVHESIYDKFIAEAVKRFEMIKVGLSWEPDTQMGALASKEQLDIVLSYVEIAKKEGATIATGGKRITTNGLDKGFFIEPTLITNATNSMRVAKEEIFGPVATVIKFKTEEEVIKMANDSEYGLAGGVWTQDINKAIRVSKAIESGRIWVNTYNTIPAGAPFGGYKTSGIGRETDKMILEHYTQVKNIMINLSDKPSGFYPSK